ncbi:FkbM family methyltransferase [Sedimentisphaera salicampi]|uniref:Methyltransferase, FkbM family n=1 Tax=Sedimentisphaera salicampi TaxID=1941349 RepID=A0A1W6LM22_9BACT|nr:FkbM family methyltransferase [Sedimentisphaera salicampi]ARN56838.1 methyltransferase, FkbM family [Sedimentisphaera salicampi]
MDLQSTWGTYKPAGGSRLLRAFVKIGLSRGSIRKKIVSKWIKDFGPIIDIESGGIKYRLNLQNNVTDRKIYLSSTKYDPEELDFLRKYCKGGVFVDIGANIGFYSLEIAKSGAKSVVSFEPNPPTLERLNYNISLNELQDKITVIPAAVGEEGELELHYSVGSLGSATVCEGDINQDISTKVVVKSLLKTLKEMGVDKIDGLKIDVEGFEDRALLPFFEKAPVEMLPKCLITEHSSREQWDTDLISSLKAIGYKVACMKKNNTVLMINN